MTSSDFDIYQTESGYAAVTNEVRRAILNALAKKDRQLPELVKITRKAKPTLSSVHMKELLAQKLVEEIHHPTDKRKKIYRLKARRIGSSSLPVEQLRSAVKQYASLSPTASGLPLSVAIESIVDAPPGADMAILERQAWRLGVLSAGLLPAAPPREAMTGLATFLEREGLARPMRLDLETLVLEAEMQPGLAPEAPGERLARVLASFVEGALEGKGLEGPASVAMTGGRRFRLGLRAAPPVEKESPAG
jgi:hypothetical protein